MNKKKSYKKWFASLFLFGAIHVSPVGYAQMMSSGQFQVSESGAATYTIPIAVSPGAGGLEPKLTLNYSSQSGNGLLGMGWSLGGLSGISRCPQTQAQDSLRGRVNYDSDDRYCLDGQRLIVVSGNYGADGSEYRTERESFAKVVSYGVAGNGPAWFKVWTKAGQIMEYGKTTDARIEAQGKATVGIWALNQVEDTKRNYLTVAYTKDAVNGDYYPSRIDYTGNGATNQTPNNSVQFQYEARADITPFYLAGSVSKNAVRMKAIKVMAGSLLLKEYSFVYEVSPLTQRSRIVNLKTCDADGTCIPPMALTYDGAQNSFGPRITSSYPNTHFAGYKQMVGDVNGDGKLDIIYITDGSIGLPYGKGMERSVFLGNGDGTFGPRIATSFSTTHFGGYEQILGDVNGDGKLDIVYVSDGSMGLPYGKGMERSVFLGNGDGTFGPRIATSFSTTHFGGYDQIFGDVNGDGKLDIMYVSDGSMGGTYGKGMERSVFLGKGDGTFGPRVATSFADTHFGAYKQMVGDVNGDGKLDLIYITDGSVGVPYGRGMQRSIFLGKGDGTFGPRIATSFADTHFNAYGETLGDVNGDGKLDIIYITDGSWAMPYGKGMERSVFFGNGDGTFGSRIATSFTDSHFAAYEQIVGDVNGDGKLDVMYITDGSWAAPYGKGMERSVFFSSPTSTLPDVAKSISVGGEVLIQVSYKPLTDNTIYTKDAGSNASVYPTVDVQASLHVVSSTAISNGVGGTTNTEYKYGGLKSDLDGRGLLGFRWNQAKQLETGLMTYSEYRQDWPYTGMPTVTKKTLVGAGNNGVLSQVDSHYACNEVSNTSAAPCSIAVGKRYFVYADQKVEISWDMNGTALPIVTTTTAFDNWGNALKVHVSTSDGYSKSTVNSYSNDSVNWYLGRLLRASVISAAP